MAIDFFFENSALDKMAELIEKTEALPGAGVTPTYEKGLRELLGKQKADKTISELNLYGKFKKLPDELEHTLLLTNVQLHWDKKNNAYVSSGRSASG